MATLAAVTNLPALALLGENGELERSTEPFRRWYEENAEHCRSAPELGRVLEGQAQAAVLRVDGITVDIAAMADRAGGRHVLLTLPTGALPSLGDPGEALLDGALDESPALVWLKDLEGRYVRVNSRFTTLLGTSEEKLLGRTDAELPPAETVDGPRAQDRPEGVEEPLQLEYMVGPFHGREAFVVLRFPVGDRQGTPTLVCGVAAPSSDAQVARNEAARLLRVERWSRLDADSVRAELLAEWGLLPDVRGAAAGSAAAGPAIVSAEQEAAVAEARAERATAVAERDTALQANEKLTGELGAAQAKLAELERALHAARADGARGDAEAKLAEQAAELDRALTRERERAEELERTLTLVRQRLGDDAEAARAEVQRARADADAARTEVERARADAKAAQADLEKARTDADALRTAAAADRDAAASARTELEREVRQAREQLAALERQHGSDDSGAQLRESEKARVAAETALADTSAERDAALKARVVLEGELAAATERDRVRAEGLEQAQARVKELEAELRESVKRADKAEVELQVAAGRVKSLEGDLQTAVARADQARGDDAGAQLMAAEKAHAAAEAALAGAVAERDAALKARVALEGELAAALERERVRGEALEQAQAQVHEIEGELRVTAMRADKAEIEAEQWRARVTSLEAEFERTRKQLHELEDKLTLARTQIAELEAELKASRDRAVTVDRELEVSQGRIGALEAEVKVGRALADELESQLGAGQGRVDELEGELAAGRARVDELEGELEASRARADELEGELDAGRARVDELEARIEELDAEAASPGDDLPEPAVAVAPPTAVESPAAVESASPSPATELATLESVEEVRPTPGPGVSWQPTAKRNLSASLARESVWRNVLKETVQVLGSEGGWDTVTAWLPDDTNGLGCAAIWTAHRGLDRFEALTLDEPVKRDGSLLDQALQAPHLTWLTDLDAVDDERLQTAAAHGMSSALLLPVRTGSTTIGLLELLTHDTVEPDAQIALSLEASALQLGRFGHLLSLGTKA